MALHDLARSATRARKRYAMSVVALAQSDTPKAKRRAERRSKAARRSLLEAARAVEIAGASGLVTGDTKG